MEHFKTAIFSNIAFERLQSAVAPGAFHNSGERFDPPKCHPRTRLAITERIMNWVLGKESTSSVVMWLHGAAGAGKSAIAQRIAELCYEAEILLASYFCSRSHPRRSQVSFIFPTIAYQIACAIPAVRAHVEQAINRDPLIFTRSLEAQMVALIVKPLQPLIDSGFFSHPTSSPRLIIIDGLDEILDRKTHGKCIEVISNVLRRYRVPLIFLIASRPEQEIMCAFNAQPIVTISSRIALDDTFHPDDDIRLFLDDSFSDIKANHPRRDSIPSSWPSTAIIDELVFRASGQFIYASTVIRFLRTIRSRPRDQLNIVLGLRPANQDLPFAELDALYLHIFQTLEHPEKTLLILGMLRCLIGFIDRDPISTAAGIEEFLELDTGDLELLLADITSLVSFNAGYPEFPNLHESFAEFLFDPTRSGVFSINRGVIHAKLAHQCFRQINVALQADPREEGRCFDLI